MVKQKHNGNIKMRSKVGKGTEFTIILPIEQSKTEGKQS